MSKNKQIKAALAAAALTVAALGSGLTVQAGDVSGFTITGLGDLAELGHIHAGDEVSINGISMSNGGVLTLNTAQIGDQTITADTIKAFTADLEAAKNASVDLQAYKNAGIVPGTITAKPGDTAKDNISLGVHSAVSGNNNVSINGKVTGSANVAFGKDSVVNGSNSTAIGNNSHANANQATALGQNAWAQAAGSVALGNNSVANVANVVSVGSDTIKRKIVNVADGVNDNDAVNVKQLNAVSDDVADVDAAWKAWQTSMNNAGITAGTAAEKGFAAGKGAVAKESAVALGYYAQAGAKNAISIGALSQAYGEGSVALGEFSAVTGKNSVALGSGSNAKRDNVVSVGSQGSERQIINVAAGTEETDAVNKGQLDAVNEDVLTNASNISSLGERVGTADFSRTNYAKGDTVTQAIYGLDTQVKTNADAIAVNARDIELLEGVSVQYDNTDKDSITLGGTGGTTITNLKAGVNDSDAVNYGQLRPVETYANELKDAGLTGGSLTATGKLASTLGSTALGTGSHIIAAGTDSWWSASAATATTSMAIGNAAGINVGSAALSSASANSALALGSGAQITAGSAGGSAALADSSIAIGTGATITATGVLGSNGNAANSVALGTGASVYNASGSVALGSGSKVESGEDNVISVGSTGSERKIIHVADGTLAEGSKDAVNGGQLYATNTYAGIGTTLSNGAANLAAGINTNYDLIQAAQTEAEKHTTVTGKSDNVIIHPSTNEDGSTNYDVSLNPHLTLTSIANENGNGINLAEATMTLGSVSIQDGDVKTADYSLNDIGYNTALIERVDDHQTVIGGIVDVVGAGSPNAGLYIFTEDGTGLAHKFSTDGSATIGEVKISKDGAITAAGGTMIGDVLFTQTKDKEGNTLTTISGVADGVYDTDAVNKSQLNAVQAEAGKHTTLTTSDSNVVLTRTDTDGQLNYDVAINPNLTVTSVSNGNNRIDLAAGTASLLNENGQGLTISGGSTLLNYGTSSLMTSASGTTIASGSHVFMVDSNGTSIYGSLNYNGWTNVLDGIDSLKTVTRLDGTTEAVSSLPQYMQANREDILTLNSQVQGLSGTVTSLSKNSVQYDSDDHSSVSFDGANGTALNNVSSINGQGDSKLDLGENGASLSNGGSSLTVNSNGVTANGDLTVNGDTTMNGSLSVNGGNGNSLTVDSTGTHVVGDFTVNGSTVATEQDVTDIKNSLGDGDFTNGGLTYTDAINKNTDGIAANAGAIEDTRDHIGVDADGNFAELTNGGATITEAINKNTDSINTLNTTVGDGKLDNGAADLTSGINANTAAIQQNSNAISELGRSVNKLGDEIDSVGAISAALAGLHPIDYDPTGSKYQLAAAFGSYDGSTAFAMGGFYNVNPDILLSLGVSTALKGERKTAGNVGVTFRVGAGKSASATGAPETTREVQQQLAALKQENNALIDRNANLEDRVAAQDKKLSELEAQMKALLAAAPSALAKAEK